MNTAAIVAALLCTTSISLLPNILLFIFPNYAPDSPMLAIGQALAAGGLFGDVFLHTLPHAMMDGKGDHEHVETIGIAIIVGFLVFFVFDVVVRSFGHGHSDTHENGHEHHPKEEGKSAVLNENSQSKNSMVGFFSSTVILNLVADSMHNFTDGIAIGASFAGVSTAHHESSSSLFDQVLSLTQSRGGLASLAVLFHVSCSHTIMFINFH